MVELSILHSLQPLSGLSEARLQEVAAHCELEKFPVGSDPLSVPRTSDQFIYLVEGEMRVIYADHTSSVLVGGCDGANWPFGYKTAEPVKSKAITEVLMLRVDFELLGMMTWDCGIPHDAPAAGSEVTPGFAFTLSSPLQRLLPANFVDYADRLERFTVKRGEIIVREGDPGDYYYLIEAGRCQIFRQVGKVRIPIAELSSGQAFGEESLVTGDLRNATVQMLTDGVMLRMAKADFIRLVQEPLLHAVNWSEAQEMTQTRSARWLDARYAAEYAENGVPGAINVPLSEIRTAFNLLDKQLDYIVYCDNGRRSSAAAFLLARQGFSAHWLAGGLSNARPGEPQ